MKARQNLTKRINAMLRTMTPDSPEAEKAKLRRLVERLNPGNGPLLVEEKK